MATWLRSGPERQSGREGDAHQGAVRVANHGVRGDRLRTAQQLWLGGAWATEKLDAALPALFRGQLDDRGGS